MDDKITPLTNAELRWYLLRSFHILDAMAGEGMSMAGQEDPAELLSEFIDRVGANDTYEAIQKALLGDGK